MSAVCKGRWSTFPSMRNKTPDHRVPIILAVLAGITLLIAIVLMMDRAIFAFMSTV